MSRLVHKTLHRYSISDHTLAFFRICLGSIILIDLVCRAFDLNYFYTDAGVLPRDLLIADHLNINRISLHLISGSSAVQIGLFLVNAMVAMMLLVGWHTRIAIVVCWFFLMSIQNRNPIAIHGGDDVLRLISFWAMFLPLGKIYSIDALFNRISTTVTHSWQPWLNFIASFAIRSQVVLIYWCLVAARNHPEWLSEGTAVYFALQLDQFITPVGHLFRDVLANNLNLVPYLTWIVMIIETVGPLLLLFPQRFVKLAGFILLAAMHLNFGAMMYLGVFPWIDIVSLTLFLDKSHAAYGLQKLSVILAVLKIKITAGSGAAMNAAVSEIKKNLRILGSGLGLVLLVSSLWYMYSLNFCQLPFVRSCTFYPEAKAFFGQTLYLQQQWTMFSPFPLKDDGYYEMPGILRNGEEVDVYIALDSGSDELKPKYIAQTYRGDRHRKYMMNLWLKRNKEARLPYGRYLCRTWNNLHRTDYEKQLKNFKIIFHKESPKFAAEPTVEPVNIWEHKCFD